jgi:hypothetical protein
LGLTCGFVGVFEGDLGEIDRVWGVGGSGMESVGPLSTPSGASLREVAGIATFRERPCIGDEEQRLWGVMK